MPLERSQPGVRKSGNGQAEKAARALLEEVSNYAEIESGLTFIGLCGLLDPPRPEVKGAIAACKRSGVRVIVITGSTDPRSPSRKSVGFGEHGCERLVLG